MIWQLLIVTIALIGLSACNSKPAKSGNMAQIGSISVGVNRPRPPGCPDGSPYPAAQEDLSTRGHYTAGGLYRPGVPDRTPDHIPDIRCIPEPIVTNEPRSAIGNRSPYTVQGRQYQVLARADGYVERGLASYYGTKFHGRLTSNREVYDMYAFTAAHKTLPLPSFARVTNLDNGRSVIVRVNDRGPFHSGRVIDLSYAAAVQLDIVRRGTGRVEVRALTPDADSRSLYVRHTALPPAPAPQPSLPASVSSTTSNSSLSQLVSSLPTTSALAAPPRSAASSAASSEMQQLITALPAARQAPGTPPPAADHSASVTQLITGLPASSVPYVPPSSLHTTPASAAAPSSGGLSLQVASFGSRDNAQRVIGQLAGAGISAVINNIANNGRTLWQVRVNAPDSHSAMDLASRIVDLGLGRPQIVYD